MEEKQNSDNQKIIITCENNNTIETVKKFTTDIFNAPSDAKKVTALNLTTQQVIDTIAYVDKIYVIKHKRMTKYVYQEFPYSMIIPNQFTCDIAEATRFSSNEVNHILNIYGSNWEVKKLI